MPECVAACCQPQTMHKPAVHLNPLLHLECITKNKEPALNAVPGVQVSLPALLQQDKGVTTWAKVANPAAIEKLHIEHPHGLPEQPS